MFTCLTNPIQIDLRTQTFALILCTRADVVQPCRTCCVLLGSCSVWLWRKNLNMKLWKLSRAGIDPKSFCLPSGCLWQAYCGELVCINKHRLHHLSLYPIFQTSRKCKRSFSSHEFLIFCSWLNSVFLFLSALQGIRWWLSQHWQRVDRNCGHEFSWWYGRTS